MKEETKNVFAKLLDARIEISNTKMKKDGRNSYSNYDYFTPSQVSHLVSKACQSNRLFTAYSIKETEKGYLGELTVLNVDNPEDYAVFYMATAMPEIKATNESQKLGGMTTYNERYLKMSVFEIVDNNLDFDAQDNTAKQSPKPTVKTREKISDIRFADAIATLKTDKKEATLAHLRTLDLTDSQIKRIKKELS